MQTPDALGKMRGSIIIFTKRLPGLKTNKPIEIEAIQRICARRGFSGRGGRVGEQTCNKWSSFVIIGFKILVSESSIAGLGSCRVRKIFFGWAWW